MIVRFVVWSARATACMTCASRDKAQRLADFWRDTRLLGCDDWRIARVTDAPAAAEPDDARQATRRGQRPHAANDDSSGTDDDPMRLLTSRLIAQEALIDELRGRLNERVLVSVREAASQQRRVAELEQQLAALRRGRARDAGQAAG